MGFFKKLLTGEEKKQVIEERNLMNIRLNDIIMYYGKDYQVFAVIEWREEGFSWKEYKLKDGSDVCWISAEVDDGEVVSGFYEVLKDFKLKAPFPEKIEYKGMFFSLEEKGKAVGRLSSAAGKQNYQCSFYQYLSPDEKKYLAVEVFGEEIEVSLGESLKQSEINILPGGSNDG